MDTQSDLEVILEFLEEYYRQNNVENVNKLYWTADETNVPADDANWAYSDPPLIKPVPDAPPAASGFLSQSTTATLCGRGAKPKLVSTRQSSKHAARGATGSGRRLRLFHFIFEMLEDPNMTHCVSWVPAAAVGVFRFSSRHKDQVAELWGQRKGNKRPMTYQKMSRALRNYARSGEMFKVKKKLTYQFSRDTLQFLQTHYGGNPM